MTKKEVLQLFTFLICSGLAESTTVVGILGFDIELKCTYLSNLTLWFKGGTGLSERTTIYSTVEPIEFRDRLSITGNHIKGEYHLTIASVKKTDEGIYGCSIAGVPGQTTTNLTTIGPSSVQLLDKTQDDKLIGTEDHDLNISCTAVSDDPSSDMVLQTKKITFTKNSTKIIQQTLLRLDRTYDGSSVTCHAGYQRYNFFNIKDSATIYLSLKPTSPSFSPDTIATQDTRPLLVTCTSTEGRPEPRERQWKIGITDVTSSSDISSVYVPWSDTYTVTSKLTYNFSRNDNGKLLSCGFKNDAVEEFISSYRVLKIQYAPSVSVANTTFGFKESLRKLTCVADGNPSEYMFSKWQHKSKYGTVIRYLDGNNILTLPPVTEEIRYHDTGEYVCTVSNGIVGKDGNVIQKGSGYIIAQAPPVFFSGDFQIKFGQTQSNINVVVNVYSEPKYISLTWTKDTSLIASSAKYTVTDVPAVLTDKFHGTEVEVDGYRITLTIHDLQQDDFVNYTLRLRNGVDQTVEHLVILLSADPPGKPTNITLIGVSESTVTLQWMPLFHSEHEQTFFIEYRIAGTLFWKNIAVPKSIENQDDELQTYSLAGLREGTVYEIRIYAENKFNQSNTTDVVRASTIGPPWLPTNITEIASTESTITLQWLPSMNVGQEEIFVIEYKAVGTLDWENATVPKAIQVPDDEFLNYTLVELTIGTTYEIRMYAENEFNQSRATDVVLASTIGPPGTPANLTLIAATETSVTLQWLPAVNVGNELTFVIEYRMSGTLDWTQTIVTTTVKRNDYTLQTYTLSGLTDGTTYEIKMYAENEYNQSLVTDIITVSTMEKPEPPQNLTMICATESSMTFYWLQTSGRGHEQTFSIEYQVIDSLIWIEMMVNSTVHRPGHDLYIYTLSGLNCGTTYAVRMYAENEFSKSNATEKITVSTSDTCTNDSFALTGNALTGVAVGISAIIIILIIVNGILTYKLLSLKRSLARKESFKSPPRQSRLDVYDDIAENEHEKDEKRAIKLDTFEVTKTQNKPEDKREVKQKTSGNNDNVQLDTYEEIKAKDKLDVTGKSKPKPSGNSDNVKLDTYEEIKIKDKPSDKSELKQKTSGDNEYINTGHKYQSLHNANQPSTYDDLDEKPKDTPTTIYYNN